MIRRVRGRYSVGVWSGETLVLTRLLALVLVVSLALVAAPAAKASEPPQPIKVMVHTAWSLKEAAPSALKSIAQTPQGDLWLASGEGLYRFDGVHFTPFQSIGGKSLVTELVDALITSSAGDLWFGYHGGGISRIHGGRITTYAAGIPPGPVKRIAEGQGGDIWVATFGGVAVFRGAAWKTVAWNATFGRAYNLLVARDGTVWIAAQHALLFIRPGSDTVEQTAEPTDGPWAFAEAPDGRLWLSDVKWGLRVLEPAQLLASRPSKLPAQGRADALRARAILFDRDGNLWGTYQTGTGLFRIANPGGFAAGPPLRQTEASESFGAKDGLSSDAAIPLFEDREGNLWIGTELGLDRFRRADINVSNTIAKDGREGYRAVVGSSGAFFVADERALYQAQASADFKTVASVPWHPSELCAGKGGVVWLAQTRGLRRFAQGKVSAMPMPPGQRNSEVFTCAEDTAGTLWISILDVGVFTYRDGKWRGPIPISLPKPLFPRLLVAERSGGVWAYDRGQSLFLLKDGAVRTFSAAQGLRIGEIETVASNPAGTFAGGELGLARWTGDRFQSITNANYPNLNVITGITQDAEGDTWLSSIHGVIKLKTSALLQAMASPGRTLDMRRFDFRDGVPGMAQQSCCHATAFTGAADRIWFITSRGVAWVDPKRLTFNALPPPVLIRAVAVNGKALAPGAQMRFPSSVSDLQLDFAAPSLSIPERVRFLYRLEGVDANWVDPGERRQAFYTRLAPGKYRFQVIAANNDGVWNRTGASLSFVAPPTFVQTRTFAALCGLAIVGLLTLAYLWRSRQIADRLRDRLEARLKERERIARDLHDTLLQGVQGLVLRFGAIAEAAPQDGAFRREMDNALSRGEQIIGESRDHILDLRSSSSSKVLVQQFEGVAAEFETVRDTRLFVVTEGEPRELTAAVLEEVWKIGCEAIRNAFEHARAKTILAELVYDSKVLRLVVHDDGIGLTDEILRAGGRAGHFGLPGMHERARRIGAKLLVVNRHGVCLELTVPGRMAYAGRARVWERRRLMLAERAQT
jgi:signal transduction histidine kinase/ligand-binding sensor domain-containing protein